MKLRKAIAGTLFSGAILLIVAIVSAGLWLLFRGLGDSALANGMLSVAVVSSACWVLNFVVLVVCLALAQLSETKSDDEP